MAEATQQAQHSDATIRVEAEQAFLGAALLDNAIIARCGYLRSEHFADPLHGRIWACAQRLVADGSSAGPGMLRPYFEDDAAMADVGGVRYLARLTGAVISTATAPDFARSVVDAARRRAIREACEQGLALALDPGTPVEAAMAAVEGAFMAIAEHAPGERTVNLHSATAGAVLDILQRRRDGLEAPGIRTGLVTLDRLCGVFEPGELVILAGRPGSGKTTVAQFLARAVARQGHGVHFASMEMTQRQMGVRQASTEVWAAYTAWVPYTRIREGAVDDLEAERLARSMTGEFERLPVRLGPQRSKTLAAIGMDARASARAFGDAAPLGLVVIDHLGFVRAPRERQSKVHEVGDVVRGLKDMALSLNCVVLCLSQLNRGVESRDDKRPVLSDLRDSGDIEQDADRVLFAYREEYYLERSRPQRNADAAEIDEWAQRMERARNVLTITQAKSRPGAVGEVNLFCDVSIGAMQDLAI